MRHIKGENYVMERLKSAESARSHPGLLAWVLIFGLGLTAIGMIGFVGGVLAVSFTDSFAESESLGKIIMLFGGVSFLGIISAGIAGSLLGLKRDSTLKEVLEKIRGEGEVGRWRAGLEGEEEVASRLRSVLGDEWVLFSGVVVDGAWGDIDHVLVGPAGVFAIEVKNWSGEIVYDDDRRLWYRISNRAPNGEILKDPVRQIEQAAAALRRLLGIKTTPVVVFTNRNSTYRGDHPTTQVFTLPHFIGWISSQPHTLDSPEVETIVSKMERIIQSSKK